MDLLLHDPRTKQQIKDALYDFLYQPVHRHYEEKLKQIVHRNCQLLNSPHPSFIYRSVTYTSDESVKMPRRMNRLHQSLTGDMDAYLAEVKQLNEYELPYVLGFINQVLNASNDLQDYLRVLPESVHRPISELIESCSCRTTKLTPAQTEELRLRNETAVELMKKRQVLNLLL